MSKPVFGEANLVLRETIEVLRETNLILGEAIEVLGEANLVLRESIEVLGEANLVLREAIEVLGEANLIPGESIEVLGEEIRMTCIHKTRFIFVTLKKIKNYHSDCKCAGICEAIVSEKIFIVSKHLLSIKN